MSEGSPRCKASMLDACAHIIYICVKIGPNIPSPPPSLHFSVKIFAAVPKNRYIWREITANHSVFPLSYGSSQSSGQ